MSKELNDAGENLRQHVRKVLARLRALKERQREKSISLGPDITVEIDREEDTLISSSGGESPT